MQESFLDEGFILDKKIGVGQPKRIENAKILVANTAMDTDKIKIYGARVRVDSMQKVADIEKAEREKMRGKVWILRSQGLHAMSEGFSSSPLYLCRQSSDLWMPLTQRVSRLSWTD